MNSQNHRPHNSMLLKRFINVDVEVKQFLLLELSDRGATATVGTGVHDGNKTDRNMAKVQSVLAVKAWTITAGAKRCQNHPDISLRHSLSHPSDVQRHFRRITSDRCSNFCSFLV